MITYNVKLPFVPFAELKDKGASGFSFGRGGSEYDGYTCITDVIEHVSIFLKYH